MTTTVWNNNTRVVSGRRQTDLCQNGFKATINDPSHRTVNVNAPAGSPTDIYKHNPWRAPGYAPIASACGLVITFINLKKLHIEDIIK